MDSATSALVEKTLFEYNKSKGVTLIIVTHDQDLADRCDLQIHLKDGQIEKIENSTAKKQDIKSIEGVKNA